MLILKKFLINLKFILILVLLAGCQKGPSEQQLDYENQLQEVLDDHDELMKDLSQINLLLRKLEAKQEAESEDSLAVQDAEKELRSAHQSMFDWMHDFSKAFPDIHKKNKSFTDKEYEQLAQELKLESQKLEELELRFQSSIEKSYRLIDN